MADRVANVPVAKRVPHSFTRHGVTIDDPYAWLRDPGYPQVTQAPVLDYLNAENAYFETEMAPHRALVDTIFAELKGRVKDDNSSVPQKNDDFLYWFAFDAGGDYAKWYRRPVAGGSDAVILDEPELARGHELFPPRRICGQPGRAPPRLCHRHQRLRTLRAAGARPSDRHRPAGRDRELALRSGLGRGFEELPLYRRRRELALQDRLASSSRRAAIRRPHCLSRGRAALRRHRSAARSRALWR